MQTFAPTGLLFSGSVTGLHNNAQRAYEVPNGAACPALHRGAPVKFSGGVVTSVGAAGNAPILGVVNGAAWVDPTSRQPVISNRLPAGTSSAANFEGLGTRPIVYVIDDPDATFYVQANASVSAGDLGLNFNVTTLGESDVFGYSRYALQASTRTSAITGAFRIVGLARLPGNAWDNPFPMVEVKINQSILTLTSAS